MINLGQLSDIELKALSYDELAKIEQAQLNIRIIREELIKRQQPVPVPQKVEEVKQ